MPYQLSEENIKHATLSFLKTYYKNNESRGFGNTEASLDMQAGNGIIADGYLKFSVEDDPIANLSAKDAEKAILDTKDTKPKTKKTFLATFEATSQGTAEEIQYRVQNTLLFFDALAIASIIAATSYGYNYMNDQFTLNELGTFKFFGGFVLVVLASMIGYALIFKYLSRYHHIHALEQFKRYRADEQWVSYGEDVFANPGNKYLVELKKQCIKEGFGLISVDQGLQPSLVMTPARKEGKKDKRKARIFSAEKITNQKAFKWIGGIKMPIGNIKIPTGGLKMPTFKTPTINTDDYTRFTKSYWKQGAVIAAMLFVMWEIYSEERKNPNLIYVDESKYQEELLKNKSTSMPEPMDYLVETEDGTFVLNSELERKKAANDKKKRSTSSPKIPIKNKVAPKTSRQDALIISTGLSQYVSYDCNRLSAMVGNNFLVQIATANNSTEAIQKVNTFNENGFKANALWLGCFLNKNIYVIYLDDIFNDKNAATVRLEKYQKLLIAKKQDPKTAVLRAIEGKKRLQ